MELIADTLLGAGALSAAAYCLILARRLQRFTKLESGMGTAIAVLSAQVDDLTRALEKAHSTAKTSVTTLDSMTGRAETVAERLELLLASMHDLPEPKQPDHSVNSGAQDRFRVVRSRSTRTDVEAAE